MIFWQRKDLCKKGIFEKPFEPCFAGLQTIFKRRFLPNPGKKGLEKKKMIFLRLYVKPDLKEFLNNYKI